MIKELLTLTLLSGLTIFVSCGQNPKAKPADKFLDFLNNYQVDSLQILMADNFQLKRTYSTYTNDKKSFLEKYVPNSRNFNGKFKTLYTGNSGQTTHFLVEDQSDFLKYLNISNPKLKIKISSNGQDKIESMTIDTTENYHTYLAEVKEKGEQFENWLKLKYPNETNEILYNTTGLLTKRLKEYSTR